MACLDCASQDTVWAESCEREHINMQYSAQKHTHKKRKDKIETCLH